LSHPDSGIHSELHPDSDLAAGSSTPQDHQHRQKQTASLAYLANSPYSETAVSKAGGYSAAAVVAVAVTEGERKPLARLR